MPTNLTVRPREGGLLHIVATFTDEDGVASVPSEIGYTVTDSAGLEIIQRTEVASPASSVTITLSGDDLAKQDADDDLRRACLVDWTYTSDYGTDLHDQDEVRFSLADLWSVPSTPAAA